MLDPGMIQPTELQGWYHRDVAERQDAACQTLLEQMYAGCPRKDLVVAAEAVRSCGIDNPSILEVGCGSR